jgi:hypothetical protein
MNVLRKSQEEQETIDRSYQTVKQRFQAHTTEVKANMRMYFAYRTEVSILHYRDVVVGSPKRKTDCDSWNPAYSRALDFS